MATSKKIRITQVASSISRPEKQHKTLVALGLGKIGKTVEMPNNECIQGMIFKVKHLIEVEEVK